MIEASKCPEGSPTGNAPPKSHIVVVDDQPANLKLLEDLLTRQGHAVRSFPRGRLALDAAARNPPDLILLDINMPEMNGFEVCKRLKADDKLAHIPVLFGRVAWTISRSLSSWKKCVPAWRHISSSLAPGRWSGSFWKGRSVAR